MENTNLSKAVKAFRIRSKENNLIRAKHAFSKNKIPKDIFKEVDFEVARDQMTGRWGTPRAVAKNPVGLSALDKKRIQVMNEILSQNQKQYFYNPGTTISYEDVLDSVSKQFGEIYEERLKKKKSGGSDGYVF